MPVWKLKTPQLSHGGVLVAGNTVADVIAKGAGKLNVDGANLKLFLDDGFQIDEDEILLSQMTENRILVLAVTNEFVVSHAGDGISDTISETSTGTSASTGGQSSGSMTLSSRPKKETGGVPVGSLTLPDLSTGVKTALQDGNSIEIWGQMLDELVTYYARHYPNRLQSSDDYQTVGKMMYNAYPCIERFGVHPWSVLVSALSARIRTLRFKKKRKATEGMLHESGPKLGKKVKPLQFNVATESVLIPKNDYDQHKESLKDAAMKSNNEEDILYLLKETYHNRRQELKSYPCRPLFDLCTNFPVFKESKFVLEEFKLVQQKSTKEMKAYIDNLIEILDWICEHNKLTTGDKEDRHLKAFKWLEKTVGFKQGKGGSWKTIVTIKKDAGANEVEKYLKTPHEEHPKIVYFTKNGQKDLIEIVGDGMVIHLNQNSLVYAILVLLATYYVFDLVFPRKYSQTLGFIQHTVLKETYVDTKTMAFTTLLTKMKDCCNN